ncbi:MAG: DUF483 domain-containing protein [Myxococcota bacterium]
MTPRPLLAGLEVPWDAELEGVISGWRRLVKREFAGAADRHAAAERGLLVAEASGRYGHAPDSAEVRRDAGEAQTLFIARDAPTLEEALEHERAASQSAGRERRVAEAKLGRLLGYPACCIRAHVDADDQGEDACFQRLLGTPARDPLPAGNNLFLLAHQLISHFPCSLQCEASNALAETALAALERAHPQRARALTALLTAPITVWDRFRFVIEHPTHGAVIAEQLTHAQRLLAHPPYIGFRAALPALPPGGARLTFVRVE